MNRCIKRCLATGMFVGGIWVLGSGIASADAPAAGHHPAVNLPISAPVTVSGNAVSVLGRSWAGSQPTDHPGTDSTTHSAHSAAHRPASAGSRAGTAHRSAHSWPALYAPVHAPVTVCGNAVGVLGRASASCGAGSQAESPNSSTSGSKAVVHAPVTAPVTVCGNAVGILGSGNASCSLPGGRPASSDGNGTGLVNAPVTAPITVCGNGAGMIGSGTATCSGPAEGPGTPASPAPQSPTPQSPAPQSPAPQSPAPPASAIEPISYHRGSGQLVGSGAAGSHQEVLASSGHSLAFTGASIALMEGLGLSLLLTGFALCLIRRRSTT
jgi:hypothetical protein